MSDLIKEAGTNSENGSNSSSSNGEGGGNNSDNSALVSLGNTSFGFNFESDGGFNNSSGSNSEEGDSDQGDGKPKAIKGKDKDDKVADGSTSAAGTGTVTEKETQSVALGDEQSRKPKEKQKNQEEQGHETDINARSSETKSSSDSMKPPPPGCAAAVSPSSSSAPGNETGTTASVTSATTNSMIDKSGSHKDAAAAAVANLNSIATAASEKRDLENEEAEKRGLKRKAQDCTDDDSGGYNSDVDCKETGAVSNDVNVDGQKEVPNSAQVADQSGAKKGGGKKKKIDDSKREERNAREKERSFRISKQINELRNLLSSGGVIVPKGTKSSVLTEAANYIRMLQQHQYRSEIDRHQLVQQVQRIGSGALGQQAATAVRHVAAQNGVWSLGNFGGVPPKSAMMYHQPSANGVPTADETTSSSSQGDAASSSGFALPNKIEEADYRHVFNSATIGMAIASMGGAFIDCNKLFCQISNYTKQEICSMTVFNLTARQDLQSAFDLISQMLSAPLDPTVTNSSCVLRGSLKHRTDIGLNVKLIKGGDGVAKCFCVTLIMNPASPYDTSKPTLATIQHVDTSQILPLAKDSSQGGLAPSPAYTTG